MDRTFTIFFIDNDLGDFEETLTEHFAAKRPRWALTFLRTAKEAVGALSGEGPDAVVMDVALSPGGREGLELLTHIKHHLPRTPVVLYTGAKDTTAVRDAYAPAPEEGDLTAPRLEPDGFFFAEEILERDSLEVLEWTLARALHAYGRVSNPAGVLVTHGTDTMAWAFAYLRYALKNLKANVAVTGSQVPLEGRFSVSDAIGNLKTAVVILNNLRPAHLFAVFNNGRSVFSGKLTKYRKWDQDAFEGSVAATTGADGMIPLQSDWVVIPYPDQRLEELHLIRTGGTIESARDPGGADALKPGGDFVWSYLNEALSGYFRRSSRHDLFALDSSNMSFEEWARVAEEVAALGVAEADTAFDTSVKPVFANPAFTTGDYRRQFEACGAGAVLAAFGGGNANVLEGSARSLLPALRASVEAGTFVAVTSQVPLEAYDAEYEAGLKLLEAGGVPSGDLPLADAQVKLAYLLGHEEEIRRAAAQAGVEAQCLLASCFLSGVSMRRERSRETLRRVMAARGFSPRLLPVDPFLGKPFAEGLRTVLIQLGTGRRS